MLGCCSLLGGTLNATAEKFGYPDALVARSEHWLVLVRPVQPTLGSLVLVCTEPARRFGEIGAAAGADLVAVADRIERALARCFEHDRLNYLMLMMVDPDVHFHVLPRYESARELAGGRFEDASWPGPPDLSRTLTLTDAQRAELTARLRDGFAAVA
jgi:diadenosine tetraphosphate (Ap4A) HIT family hydrolase